jgi:Cu+-exporting ATPase
LTIAVVFDSAGTLLRTYRVAKETATGQVLLDIESTTLTYSVSGRVLVVLHVHSRDMMAAPSDQLISTYLQDHQIGFGIACSREVIPADTVGDILYHDTSAVIGDAQECIRAVWTHCKRESLVVLNSGVIVNVPKRSIEFAVTSGGKPFSRAKETITALHRMGVATYIASGDRSAKLETIADYLGIPADHVNGIATPSIKAQIVEDLKGKYDSVVMVGDGINDISALKAADIAILSDQQQCGIKPDVLYCCADHVIKSVSEVVEIVRNLPSGRTLKPARTNSPHDGP